MLALDKQTYKLIANWVSINKYFKSLGQQTRFIYYALPCLFVNTFNYTSQEPIILRNMPFFTLLTLNSLT